MLCTASITGHSPKRLQRAGASQALLSYCSLHLTRGCNTYGEVLHLWSFMVLEMNRAPDVRLSATIITWFVWKKHQGNKKHGVLGCWGPKKLQGTMRKTKTNIQLKAHSGKRTCHSKYPNPPKLFAFFGTYRTSFGVCGVQRSFGNPCPSWISRLRLAHQSPGIQAL